jgi:hypothetical protein
MLKHTLKLAALGLTLALSLQAAAQTTAAPVAQAAPTTWANLPQRPFLAIDAKAHSDEAFYLVLTPDEKRAVTAAFDGSVRVWDVQTGELLQRFFLPKGGNNSTLLRALAISPDGQRVAVSGHNMRRAIMIVSLQTGAIQRVITGTEDTGMLAWSTDGRYLAAGRPLGQSPGGLRVYSLADGKEVFRDTDYTGGITGLEFRADGAFYGASWDGRRESTVKLYKPENGTFRETAKRKLQWGDYRSHWDAAGQTILVGVNTRLDGETLAEMPHAFNRTGLPSNTWIARLTQKPDGGAFYGTTWSQHSGQGLLRRWAAAGAGGRTDDVKLPDAQVADIAVTRAGEVVYITPQGTVGMVDADLKLAWRVAADVADLQRKPRALKISEEGYVWLPVSGEDGRQDVAFNLADPGFVPVARVKTDWKEPATSSREVAVFAWESTANGTVNDAPFPFVGSGERSLAVAVHSREGTVAVGSNWERLYKVSPKGERLWFKYLGSDVVAVNLIESRDLVVAATANGMLRVFRWGTGELVMTYYLQPQQKRWIALSSQGYYEASLGAEDSAGWVVNPSSARVADFMPMSRFRSRLLLTGLASKAWELRSENQAVKGLAAKRDNATTAQSAPSSKPTPVASAPAPSVVVPPVVVTAPTPAPAASSAPTAQAPTEPAEAAPESGAAVRVEEMPPRIEIVAPGYQLSTDKRQVTIRLKVVSSSEAPVTNLRTLIASGSSAQRNLAIAARPSQDGEREVTVEIPPEDTDIRIVAENRFGASVPTVVRVSYTGPKPGKGQGTLYVLAVGVSRYDNPAYTLGLPAKDAQDFANTLLTQRGAQYADVQVRQLLDREASRPAIEAGLDWLRQKMTPVDTAVVFLAGHGFNEGPTYYYMSREANLEKLSESAVPFTTLRANLTALQGRVLLFVDTCHAGNVIGRFANRQARDATGAINELASAENGLVVFASSTGGQFSQENAAWGNGAFTKAVVEGLQGAADFKKRGRITYKGLDAYVSDRVDELTRGEQTPVTPVLQGVPDFVIALLKK